MRRILRFSGRRSVRKLSMLMRDYRNVGSQRKRDPQSRGGRAISPIVLQQTLTHVARRHADDCIFACVVAWGPAEQLHPDYPLFQGIQMTFDCLFHDVAKKLRAPVAPLEGSPFHNFGEVFPDGDSLLLCLCNFGLTRPFFR